MRRVSLRPRAVPALRPSLMRAKPRVASTSVTSSARAAVPMSHSHAPACPCAAPATQSAGGYSPESSCEKRPSITSTMLSVSVPRPAAKLIANVP